MKNLHYFSWFFLIVILLFTQSSIAQFNIPKKPSFQTSVYDYAAILEPNQEKTLEEKLIRYSDSTSTQIVVITVETINGENIGLLASKWGQDWGIGQKNEDNGIVILLAKNERKIHIAPGYGAEEKLTAGLTGTIVRNIIIPEFKKGDYYAGLNKGSDAIFEVLTGKFKETRTKKEKFPSGALLFIIIFILIVFLFSRGNKGGRGGNRGKFSGPDLADIIVLSSLGRGNGGGFFGGTSGGFGGGGFSGGFGGGGFSGGGAGGSW